MADYRVKLEVFSGPLDLLLYLVRKDEVDIYDISINEITEQYLRYLEMLQSLDIDLAGDFLVMAATLMQIKSAMLLPKADPDDIAAQDLSDPRAELIRQLLEYKKFKDAANQLNAAALEQQQRFGRPATVIEQLKSDKEPEIDMEQVSVWDLLEAFDSIMRATGSNIDMSHIKDETPIDLYQIEILHRLQTEGPMSFEKIFESQTRKIVMVGLFLALLELVRDKLVWVEQQGNCGPIYLKALTEEPAEQAVQKAILTAAAETEANQPTQAKTTIPPVEIMEIPSKTKTPALSEPHQADDSAVPIVEIPPKESPTTSTQQLQQQDTDKDSQHTEN